MYIIFVLINTPPPFILFFCVFKIRFLPNVLNIYITVDILNEKISLDKIFLKGLLGFVLTASV